MINAPTNDEHQQATEFWSSGGETEEAFFVSLYLTCLGSQE